MRLGRKNMDQLQAYDRKLSKNIDTETNKQRKYELGKKKQENKIF